jgi:hypothetical protein
MLGIVLTLFALAAAGIVRWLRTRRVSYEDPTPPLITIPHSPVAKPMAPSRARRQTPHETLPVPVAAPSPPAPMHAAPSPPAPMHAAPMHAPPPPPRPAPRPHDGNGSDGDLVDGNTIKFYRPPDGTLQLLPGRLEIVAGEDMPHDIRFLRARGEEPQVTFGRGDGPPHRHVQLHARTVSRNHARMRFADRQWLIENLSETNPVVINGNELDSNDGGYVLKEGDRIEMGEVVFLFRER